MTEEVRTTLHVDDRSEAALKHAEEGFKKVDAAAQAAGHSAHGASGSDVAHGTMVGHLMAEGIEWGLEKAHEAVEEFFEFFKEGFTAAQEAFNTRRMIAGVLSMTDQTGAGFNVLMDRASLFHEGLQEIGIEAGVAESELSDAFAGIAARTGKTAAEVEHLTEEMAYAGKAVRGGTGALSQGFEAIEMGVIRARNPVVQLIAASGQLHGTAKNVAAQMMKMTPEHQIEIATKAIEKMSQKMKEAPPTMESLAASFHGIKEQMFEALGMPMVETLTPILDGFKKTLIENKDDIAEAMRGLGKEVGSVMEEEAAFFAQIRHDMREDGVLTEDSMKHAGESIKDSFEQSLKGANLIAEVLIHAADGITMAFSDAKNFLTKAAESGSMGSWAKEKALSSNAEKAVLGEGAFTREGMDKINDALAKLSLVAGERGDQDMLDRVAQLRAHAEAEQNEGAGMRIAVDQGNAHSIATYYNQAVLNHEDGQKKYLAHLLAGSEEAQTALLKSGETLKDGLLGLVTAMKEAGDKEKAEEFAKRAKAQAGAGPVQQHIVNISGGITVHQEFRDADPDRVMISMKKEISRNAENRIAARTGLPFGP